MSRAKHLVDSDQCFRILVQDRVQSSELTHQLSTGQLLLTVHEGPINRGNLNPKSPTSAGLMRESNLFRH